MTQLVFSNDDFRVIITPRAIVSLTLLAKGDLETGGVLIGHYDSDDNAVAFVERASIPPPDSSAGPNWFVRGTEGLKETLAKHWEVDEHYLGEWHYHPAEEIEASDEDFKQMAEISVDDDFQCKEPILIIVGKREELDLKVFLNGTELRKSIVRLDDAPEMSEEVAVPDDGTIETRKQTGVILMEWITRSDTDIVTPRQGSWGVPWGQIVNRVVVIELSRRAIPLALSGYGGVYVEGLPEDIHISRVWINDETLNLCLYAHHPNFDPVPEFGKIPRTKAGEKWTHRLTPGGFFQFTDIMGTTIKLPKQCRCGRCSDRGCIDAGECVDCPVHYP